MTNKNLYDVLDVSSDATQKEIKEAYRLIVSMLHPDKFPQDSKQWVSAHKKIQEINEAYQILKAPERRAQYDFDISLQPAVTASERNQTSNPRTDYPTPPPESARPKPSPVASEPEVASPQNYQAGGAIGCGGFLCGFLGAASLVAIFVNVTLDPPSEFSVSHALTYAGLALIAFFFFWGAFTMWKDRL